MSTIQIKKGKNIPLKGAAEKAVTELRLPGRVAVVPTDFRGIKARVLVKEGDAVKVGTPVLEDKNHPGLRIVSPASGKVAAIQRGEKRALQAIVIETDGAQQAITFTAVSPGQIPSLTRQQVVDRMLEAGLWPFLRQRPFSQFADPAAQPKSIFIQAMNTEPLAADYALILEKHDPVHFQAGVDLLKKLTAGPVHACCHASAKSELLAGTKNMELHRFAGPHPAGNVSTHIHHVDPIRKGEIVWYINALDVARLGALFVKGEFSAERYVAVTGEGALKRQYVKTLLGTPVPHLIQDKAPAGMRFVSGSVLNGRDVGPEGFLRFYDTQLTVIPAGGERQLLGWILPGFSKYSFSRAFASRIIPQNEVSLNTDINGSHRAIVLNHLYDDYVPLDIMVYFLLKAVLSGDLEEAERLGILECDEEDFALCSFACPSKTDVGQIVRQGLDMIEKEG